MALKDLPRDQIVVATKVGRYGAETFDFSADRVIRSVHESLARLQIPYIDLIQCHDMEFGSLDQVRGGLPHAAMPSAAPVGGSCAAHVCCCLDR
jgi:aryl-alcohol dehydrogenase-like predicted oxidoreductase